MVWPQGQKTAGIWEAHPGAPLDDDDIYRFGITGVGILTSLVGFIWWRKYWFPYITAPVTAGLVYKWTTYDKKR